MKVLKFGGTSVGTAFALNNVRQIIESQTTPVIVVVSALGGVTDALIRTAHQASSGDMEYTQSYKSMVLRHNSIISEIMPEKADSVIGKISGMFDELGDIYRGISLIRDLPSRTLDIILSYGERLSSTIISEYIDGASIYDSKDFIKTKQQFDKHVLDKPLTESLIHKAFGRDAGNIGKVAIVPGFVASNSKGEPTNLGRGGSDYTAAILAAALGAEELQIWTDVDGFMTADPRLIPSAYVIDRLSFLEAMELCNYGAKVIYPPTIYPVYHKNIPIRIKNTFNPSATGTLISKNTKPSDGKAIKGISSINDTSLVTVTGLGMVGIIGINARIFNALAENGISVFFVSQTSSENNTTIAVSDADAALSVNVLRNEFASELQRGEITDISSRSDYATIAIVGENMQRATGIAGKLFNTLGRNGINAVSFAQGVSETNISCVIERGNLNKALNVIHDSFFLSDTQVLHVYVAGIGNVGRKLIQQIKEQQARLRNEKSLEIKIVGISNSRNCLLDRNGIDLDNYKPLLDQSDIKATPDTICDEILRMDLFNSVFVDCTASDDIPSIYPRLLSANVNVVTANKLAASGKYDVYKELKDIASHKDVKFLFETNVGAGLPVINTINSLINSGDRLLRIEAVLSGTLNYIFSTLSPSTPLGSAIKKAQQEGYCEPDPRVDLSGIDVVRKIVILARESGYAIDQSDVDCNLFLPDDAFNGDVDQFHRIVSESEAALEAERREAENAGNQLRFVAILDSGKAKVGLEKIGSGHPFFNLKGSNNVIMLTTERYHEYPMVIKGYGAGADVTAAGVFADIISIANIR